MKLTPGSRWMSPVCNTEVVVLKAPASDTALECGGSPMVAVGNTRTAGASPVAWAGWPGRNGPRRRATWD